MHLQLRQKASPQRYHCPFTQALHNGTDKRPADQPPRSSLDRAHPQLKAELGIPEPEDSPDNLMGETYATIPGSQLG
ncbi:hypothetical protein WJX74_008953 [Apatococcus lobatus]|uniref:Uncharacterized protein n=1 Tax=Apatococcus lobatus TaxID=904363 RepID=A0AAW1QVU5_9CHLO